MPDSPARVELRIGLVLYGGVAMGIYMAGAVQELLRLVRAGQAVFGAGSDPSMGRVQGDAAGGGAYRELLRAAGVRPVVDVVAGTSAGGLNALLLGKALACGAPDLGEASRLWIERADALALLRKPGPEAILSGSYLEAQLFEALRSLDRRGVPALATGVPVLDVFITATDLEGVGWEAARDTGVADFLGQRVGGESNLLAFQLRKRSRLPPAFDAAGGPPLGYERNDFTAPAGDEAERRDRILARLGRATAAIPLAFPPVDLDYPVLMESAMTDLWPEAAPRHRRRWLSDGGILLNRPFPPVIRTIFGRIANRPVERVLLYLDPDPGTVRVEQGTQSAPALGQVLAAASTLLRKEDIRQYLEDVGSHNRRVSQVRRALLRAELRGGGSGVGPVVLVAYGTLRRQRLSDYYLDGLRRAFARLCGPARERVPDPGPVVRALLDSDAGVTTSAGAATSAETVVFSGAVGLAGNSISTGAAAEDVSALEVVDPPFQARRLQYLIHLVGEFYPRGGDPAELGAAGRLEAMLWEIHEYWRQAEWELFHPDELPVGNPLRAAFESALSDRPEAAAALARAIRQRLEEVSVLAEGRLEVVWAHAAVAGTRPPQPGVTPPPDRLDQLLARAFWGFLERDVFLFPLAEFGDLGEWDEVRVGRLSPVAESVIRVPGRRKLAGEVLGYFGGFLSRRWRHSDLMWGRLDTAESIVRLVVRTALGHLPTEEAAALQARISEVVAACHREILLEEADALDVQALRALMGREPENGVSARELVAAAPYAVLREYLERHHTVGSEGLLDLPALPLARVVSKTVRNLARALSRYARRAGWAGRVLAPVAAVLRAVAPVAALAILAGRLVGGLVRLCSRRRAGRLPSAPELHLWRPSQPRRHQPWRRRPVRFPDVHRASRACRNLPAGNEYAPPGSRSNNREGA